VRTNSFFSSAERTAMIASYIMLRNSKSDQNAIVCTTVKDGAQEYGAAAKPDCAGIVRITE
jgi:hypothetical protein